MLKSVKSKIDSAVKFLGRKKPKAHVIIVGTDYPEYKLHKQLNQQCVQVHYFISEDPWKYNSLIEGTPCRNLKELACLCDKYSISKVYYCDKVWEPQIPALPMHTELVFYSF